MNAEKSVPIAEAIETNSALTTLKRYINRRDNAHEWLLRESDIMWLESTNPGCHVTVEYSSGIFMMKDRMGHTIMESANMGEFKDVLLRMKGANV